MSARSVDRTAVGPGMPHEGVARSAQEGSCGKNGHDWVMTFEAFGLGVLRQFTRLDESVLDPDLHHPQAQGPGREFRAIVSTETLWVKVVSA